MVMRKSEQAAVVVCLLSCFVAACPTRADELTGVKNGYYLGVLFGYNGMSGDFDDSMFFEAEDETDSELFNVPDVDGGAGIGVFFGRRFDKISVEVGYQATFHDTSTVIPEIGDADAVYNVVDLNVKIDVFARDKFRPYILLGGGIPWLTIEDNRSKDDGLTWDEDIKYVGYCLNAGVGAAYYFDPQWALTAGLIHRWNWFTHGEDARLDDDLSQRAFGLTLGLAYTF